MEHILEIIFDLTLVAPRQIPTESKLYQKLVERNRILKLLNDFRVEVSMKVIRGNREYNQELIVSSFYGRNGERRTLFLVKAPIEVKNSAFLSIDLPDCRNEKWLYLTGWKRVIRLFSEERCSYFLESDFTYEDIAPTPDSYQHTVLEEISGDTKNETFFVVETVPLTEQVASEVAYARRISYIHSESMYLYGAEFYDTTNKITRLFCTKGLRKIKSGIYLPQRMILDKKSSGDQRRTELNVKNIEVNVGLKIEDFSRYRLKGLS